MNRAWAGGLGLAGLLALATPVHADLAHAFDRSGSSAGITVDLRVAGEVDGRFGAIDGELRPEADGRWVVSAEVDAGALRLDGPAWMQRSMRSPRFLDVERHPRIAFRSEPFARELLQAGGELAGDLTLRGRTRRVAFRVEPSTCADPGLSCPIHVRGTVSRRAFGMTAQRLWLRDAVGFDFHARLRPAR
jgi:polyisoprenoid-binding protein YceI